MIVEIVKTLKGSRVWKKGTVLTDPVPAEILKELMKQSPCVRVKEGLTEAEKPVIAEVEIENEKEIEEAYLFPIDDLTEPEESEEPEEPEEESNTAEELDDPETSKELETFFCTICGWSGKTGAALKRHITMNHQ